MTQTETRTELPTDVQPQIYRLRTPLMKQGRLDTVLATTDTMQVRMKSYAQGGENALHAHSREDHTFIVLAGEARFWGQGDVEMGVFGRNEAVMLPRGCFYRFESCGDVPLVMVRIGAKTGHQGVARVTPDGQPIAGDSHENKTVPPIVLEGAFYE